MSVQDNIKIISTLYWFAHEEFDELRVAQRQLLWSLSSLHEFEKKQTWFKLNILGSIESKKAVMITTTVHVAPIKVKYILCQIADRISKTLTLWCTGRSFTKCTTYMWQLFYLSLVPMILPRILLLDLISLAFSSVLLHFCFLSILTWTRSNWWL